MKQHKTVLQAALVGILLTIGFLVYAQDNVSPTPTDSKEVKAVLNDKACANCSIGGSCEGCSSVKEPGTEKGTKAPQCRLDRDCNSEYCEVCVDGRCEEACLASNCMSCGREGSCISHCDFENKCEHCENGSCIGCKPDEDCEHLAGCKKRCNQNSDCPNCRECLEGHCQPISICPRCQKCDENNVCVNRCPVGQYCDAQENCVSNIPCVPECREKTDCEKCNPQGNCISFCPQDSHCDGWGRCEFNYPPYT